MSEQLEGVFIEGEIDSAYAGGWKCVNPPSLPPNTYSFESIAERIAGKKITRYSEPNANGMKMYVAISTAANARPNLLARIEELEGIARKVLDMADLYPYTGAADWPEFKGEGRSTIKPMEALRATLSKEGGEKG